MFDTHCHLNFKRFKKNLNEVVMRAFEAGVTKIVIPGTDIESSIKAIEIAEKYDRIHAAVGIHPHHAHELVKSELLEIEKLMVHPKVVAIGEVGMDRHAYEDTKYEKYAIDDRFLEIQRQLLQEQINLAIKHNKSLVLHNREAAEDLSKILQEVWDEKLSKRTVFHCCEPNLQLFQFAKEHHIFIGVDGDVTHDAAKQEFIKLVPLEMLVVETDSPFILPEPLLSQKKYPNEPANVRYVVGEVAKLKNISIEKVAETTFQNGQKLFGMSSKR